MIRQLEIAIMLSVIFMVAACSGGGAGKVMEVRNTGDTSATTTQGASDDTDEELAGEPITVAVLDFENNTTGPKKDDFDGLKFGLTDMFITELSKIKAFTVIERTRLTEVANELALTDLAGLDTDTAQQVGRLLGAQVLYYGSFSILMDRLFYLHGRLVRVETGVIMIAEDKRDKYDPEKLFDYVVDVSKALKKAIKKEHKFLLADIYYSEGRTAEEEEDDTEKAIELYKKALEYDPKHEASMKALQRLEEE